MSDNKLNLCLSVVFTAFLGRVIPIELLWGRATITSVFRRLSWRRDHCRTNRIKDMARRFPRMHFFAMNDDTGRAHGQNTAYPYIEERTGERIIEREMLTVSAYTKKSSENNAKVNYDTMVKRDYPMSKMGGGCGDHPAEKETRLTTCYAHDDLSWLALFFACGLHKTNLVSKMASSTSNLPRLHQKCFLSQTIRLWISICLYLRQTKPRSRCSSGGQQVDGLQRMVVQHT